MSSIRYEARAQYLKHRLLADIDRLKASGGESAKQESDNDLTKTSLKELAAITLNLYTTEHVNDDDPITTNLHNAVFHDIGAVDLLLKQKNRANKTDPIIKAAQQRQAGLKAEEQSGFDLVMRFIKDHPPPKCQKINNKTSSLYNE